MFNLPEKILGSDWFFSLIIGIFLLLMAQLNFLQPLELIAYDLSIQHINRYPGDKVAVIAIDDRSIAQLGNVPTLDTVSTND